MTGILNLGLKVSLILLAGLSSIKGSAAQATEADAAPSSAESTTAFLPASSPAEAPIESTAAEAIPAEDIPTEEISADETRFAVAPRLLSWDNYPVNLFLLDPDIDPQDYGVITNRTVSQTSLTTPSLWWARDQFGGKLLEHWLAYPGSEAEPRRVDLIVDRQLWSLSSYLDRYTFINQFGTAAKSFGYNIRVFNDQGNPQASYICNFPASLLNERAIADEGMLNTQEIETQEVDCNVSLNSSGAGALRGQSGGFESLF